MNDTTTSIPGERDVRLQVPLWRLTGTFTLLTPLHIGTGRDAEIRLDEERMGSDKETRAQDESRYVATVVRDHLDRPCIPASSFKGALAALARCVDGIDAAQHERLFGAVKGDKTTSGGVEFTYLYAQPDTLPQTSGLPQFGRPDHPHVAHLAHVSRNRDTGAAEAQRLFLSQVVPPGVVFGFDCTARGLSREDMGVLLGLLALAGDAREGLRLGAGKAADQGRVSWHQGDVWCLDADKLAALWASDDGRMWTDRTRVRDLKTIHQTVASGNWLRLDGLVLDFYSPFLVYERTGEKGTGKPNGKPRTNHAGCAVLPSTSLHGALRAQAERILRTIGRETPAGYEVPGVQGLDDAGRTLDLASVLFGAPGWRSLLRCSDFVDDGTSQDITHHMLAIDRLTGGGKDSAKFSITVRDCPTLNGSLAVDLKRLEAIEAKRPGVTAQVLGLLAHVLRDLDEGDIPLGYGASKGYGQLRSGTADRLRDSLADLTDVPDLTECLGAFAALSGADASDGLALQAAARPARQGSGPARATVTTSPPAAQDKTFHNPYTFVPFGEPKPDDRRLPWLKEQAYRSGNLGHHAHGAYHAGTCHGRLICRLRATTPLFVGAGPVSDDASMPRKQENYRLGKELAIPATTLRGLFSSLHESITASALRVMTEQSYSMRVSANQHFPHSGMVIEVKGVRNGKPVTGYKIRHQKTGRESVAGQDYPFTVAAMERLYELADQRTESMKTDWPDGKVPADQIRPEVKPKGVARNREQHPFKARLMPGQTVFFRLSPDGTRIDEMAWSQIWRQRVEDTDKRPWKTTRAMTEPATRVDDQEKLTPMTEEARALSPSELLFGAVQVPAKRNKDAADEPAVVALMGKVRFSAAVALPVAGKSLDTERDWTTLKILSSPKPPSPSFYFQPTARQGGASGYISKHEFSKNPKAYAPKGRKSYLHAWRHKGQVVRYDDRGQRVTQLHDGFWPWQSNVNLPPPPPKKDGRGKVETPSDPAKQKVRVKLIPVGSEFEFSVDFVNLSEEELSSLCAALMPAEKFEHKVGMGKPIGLGSVRIEPLALQLIDRRHRYRQTDFTASNRFETLNCSPRDLAQEQMRHVAPDVRAALELVGNPDAVNRPVHYPQVWGGLVEQQTYQWFVENDRTGADVKRQWLKPLGEKTKELPTLERLSPMPTGHNAPGRPRGGR
ncbi:MAG: RAMP superfamily CRISPR-associated protein [Sphaerotilus natans subsp. sulfidivorans]|uniref:RAMP superfamily CRISPR-associated protein n=1 Tax=Sphaerotilus sulfidivorans TaxID=639200 RepID=UPI0023554983|nr:RAMP superfamily CRISPR-associated protein [Sphaerotilus sulfidivorans]MCK6401066.1 RAMP superfamily CRISPR-associated protein [Sphaerotilus sulfidivorans]